MENVDAMFTPKGDEAFHEGLRSTPAGQAAEDCRAASMDAFRCADLQGHRHPNCLARLMITKRCFARFVAPSFLDRLELCERDCAPAQVSNECAIYTEDLARVVDMRMDQHAVDMVFSPAERRAFMHCGSPSDANSPIDLKNRVACLAPLACPAQFAAWKACASGKDSAALCVVELQDLMYCAGATTSKLSFRMP